MAFYLSPLVDIREIDLTTTVPAVATSVGVLILRNSWKGPEKKKQLITTEDELIDTFGRPTNTAECYKDILSAVAFLKDSSALYCTRALPLSAAFAGTTATSGASATFVAYNVNTAPMLGYDIIDPDTYGDEQTVSNPYIMSFISTSRGAWGNNLRVAVVDKTTYDLIKGRSYTAWNTYSAISAVDSPLDSTKEFLIIVQACSQTGNVLVENDWDTVEVWNVSTDENKLDDQGTSMFVENAVNTGSKYIRVSLAEAQKNVAITISTAAFQQFAGGRDYHTVLGETATVSDSVIMEALDLYSNAEEIDVNIFIDSDKSVAVKQYIVDLCEGRKDSIAILDCLYAQCVNNLGDEATDIVDWRDATLNENSSYAALYANWMEVYDKWNSKYRWVPASGYVGGIFARTDSVTDPWWAPAGLNRAILRNVRKLAWNPSKGERDILYMHGCNPIVSFAGQGKVVWGQKTLLDKSSAFNRINVRRLFIILEKAIATAARYFLFEPNDELTRLLLVNMIDPFLRDVKSRRGIYDYLVVCDSTNNTPERIDRNELWCDIYIKPTRAAEFIVLQFIATKTGANFTEIHNILNP